MTALLTLAVAGCSSDTSISTATEPAAVEGAATVLTCAWDTYPGMGEWVDVAGQVTVGDITGSVLIDLEYRIDGELVGIGTGAANGVQPGQTANWIGVVRDVPPGGECIVVRVY